MATLRLGHADNYRIDRISDAPVRNKKQTVTKLILLDKFRAVYGKEEGPFHPGGPAGGRCGTCQ